jgi:hypothetical protein
MKEVITMDSLYKRISQSTTMDKMGLVVGFSALLMGLYLVKQLLFVYPLGEGVGRNIEIAIYLGTLLLPVILASLSLIKDNIYLMYLAFFCSLPATSYVDRIEVSYLLELTTFAYLISAIFITFDDKARKEITDVEFLMRD